MIEPIPIRDVAYRLSISSRQLERLFQKEISMRPSSFYRMIRLRYAQSLLLQGEMSITQVAIETGFSDCAHFSRQFKAMFGHNPSVDLNRTGSSSGRLSSLLVTKSQSERAGIRLF